MAFTISKQNGQIIINDLGGFETRNSSTLWCIQRADEIYHFKNFPEIKICTDDFESTDNYSYSKEINKQNNYAKLVPDFNFHAWPQVGITDYDVCIKEIDKAGLTKPSLNKVGWIGNSKTNVRRSTMLSIAKQNPTLFNCIDMNWKPTINTNTNHLDSTYYISTPDLVKNHAFLIDIEGRGYSGRLKHLLWSHRPVLLVDRPHKEYFFQYLKEWKHYIPVKRDLSDLVEKTKWCIEHYAESLQIAENAYEFSKRYLTRNACYEQWNSIINSI